MGRIIDDGGGYETGAVRGEFMEHRYSARAHVRGGQDQKKEPGSRRVDERRRIIEVIISNKKLTAYNEAVL